MKIKLYMCGGEDPVSEYPLGLGYLKTNCTGADISIVNNRNSLVDCDLIGLSSTTGGLKEAVDIVSTTDIPCMLGGQGTMWDGIYEYPFKHIIKGEGERALQSIIDGNTERMIQFENIKNLDDLKYPDRGRCGSVVPILTSRGCPYNCYFCSSQNYWGKVRWHSMEYFMDEVVDIIAAHPNVTILYIMDDLFIVNKKRFDAIYTKWMDLRLCNRLELQGFIRSRSMTLEIAHKMKDMGFRNVRFGAESASNRMLELINKQETVEDHQRCIDICGEVGLNVSASLIQYLPGETVEDRQATAQFRTKNQHTLCISGNYKFQPFPGTHFYNGENPLDGDWRTRGGNVNKNMVEEGILK